MRARRPHVVVHVAVSVDGATTGFEPDVERFYELAQTWHEDVTLTGADTILAQRDALARAPRTGPAPDGPLLAVVDGRGRVEDWGALRECGRWSDVLALRGTAWRPDGRDVRQLVTRGRRVNLPAALRALGEREGARVVRVDSGGALTGALLRRGLVDELSLLIHPCVSGSGRVWHGPAPAPAIELEPVGSESVGDGLTWVRYRTALDPDTPLRYSEDRWRKADAASRATSMTSRASRGAWPGSRARSEASAGWSSRRRTASTS